MAWDLSEIHFHVRVRRALKAAGIAFDTQKAVGGVEPDFVVRAPNGALVLLELKMPTEEDPVNLERAVRQAERMKDAVGASESLVVVPDLAADDAPEKVVRESELVGTIQSTLAGLRKSKKKSPPLPVKVTRTVFVAMPFDEKYDDVFFVAAVHAAKGVNAKAIRIDQEQFTGDIVQKILSGIRTAIAVIGDISEAKANVLYEVGYAHALKKPCVHICSTPLGKLPFDVSHWNTLEYKLGQVHSFRTILAKRLKAVLS